MRRVPSVLVLGASGMLGSTIVRWFHRRRPDWRVDGATRQAAAGPSVDVDSGRSDLTRVLSAVQYDYVVNCVGVLNEAIDRQRSETLERAVRVNALFPHEVADVTAKAGGRVIHVSSDAVFSGRHAGTYSEEAVPDPTDAYGMTKALGESMAANVLNVRCSIVGRDRRGRGLVEWYLASTADRPVAGFGDYVWTPATTVQVALLCDALMAGGFDTVRHGGHVLHFAPNPPLSKAEFLALLRETVGRGAAIEVRPSPGGPCRRVLASAYADLASTVHFNGDWPRLLADLLVEFSSRGA
jgi:dTDP-4-dehydrorhamnose reductase